MSWFAVVYSYYTVGNVTQKDIQCQAIVNLVLTVTNDLLIRMFRVQR